MHYVPRYLAPTLVPLVIGVTGHRDLRPQDLPRLRESVRAFFNDLRARYPHTPLLLLSPLAEGADRLAAYEALALGVKLVVPLPLSQALYERDFTTPETLKEFRELIDQAERVIELRLLAKVSIADIDRQGPARDAQYAQVGAYIVSNCQILLALWDGNETGLTGGTSQIVRFRREGVPKEYGGPSSPLDALESGPVYHIVTPRLSGESIPPDLVPLSHRRLVPERGMLDPRDLDTAPSADGGLEMELAERHTAEAFDRVFARLETFNWDASRVATPRRLQPGLTPLLNGVQAEELHHSEQQLLGGYLTSDALAMHFQRRTKDVLRILLGLGLAAALCFSIYAHLGLNVLWLLGYLLALVVAFVIFLWSAPFAAAFAAERTKWLAPLRELWHRRGDFQSRYLDYRALAEGMRVQFFWEVGGLNDCVADHYLRKQRSELDWIRHAIRTWTLLAGGSSSTSQVATRRDAADPARAYKIVLERWIKDQQVFYMKTARRDRQSIHIKEWLVFGLFGSAIVLAVALFLLDDQLHHTLEWLQGWLIVLAVVAVGASALVDLWAEKTAIAEQAKQYARMRTLFARAYLVLSGRDRSDLADAQPLFRELGEEALSENADWLMLHRSRPVSVARGG